MQVLENDRGLNLPLERLENGRLDPGCKPKLISSLQAFLQERAGPRPSRAICALSARGVSLRRLTLPTAPTDELQRLLGLQLESEFPLPPEAFAWGYSLLPDQGRTAKNHGQDVVVAAVKREMIADYTEVLSKCGLDPVFTLAALARREVCPPESRAHSLLEIGRHYSELASIEHGVVTAARILPWGGDDITRAIEARLGLSREEAERLKLNRGERVALEAQMGLEQDSCVQTAAEGLAGLISRSPVGSKLYVMGETSTVPGLVTALEKALGSGIECEHVDVVVKPGHSASTSGLQKLCQTNGATLPLTFEIHQETRAELRSQPQPGHWIVLACLLVIVSFGLRYAEAFIRQPQLARKLAQLGAERGGLPGVDRELDFLTYFQSNQPPFLEALSIVANSAPGGTRLDSVSMTRRGDISLRGTVANSQQTTELRSKLIESDFFSAVVLDEQAPSADREKVTFRLTAQLKANGERPPLPIPVTAKEAKGSNAPGVSTNASDQVNQPRVDALNASEPATKPK